MILRTIAKCTKIIKKSASPAFQNIQIGDKILFSCDIKPSGRNKSAYVCCKNERTGGESNLTLYQIQRVLKNFEFEEMKYF